jgi:hypothetical protein
MRSYLQIMPRLFVYEHITASGLGCVPGSPEHSWYVEGQAMRDAITADFTTLPGFELLRFPDAVSEAERMPTFRQLARWAEWSLVIAPETDGVLERLTREVIAVGGRLLGPDPDAIALTSDKLRLADHWHRHGIRTPQTVAIEDLAPTVPPLFPIVLKPRDGAGSVCTFLVNSPTEFTAARRSYLGPMIRQDYVPGKPASVAFLVGPDSTVALAPTFQLLSAEGRFRYEGGLVPIAADLAERAVRVGQAAITCVPGLLGYVGVDLVLGAEDFAIEINPRLTTSYVGLRALARENLAGLLFATCTGQSCSPPVWRSERVRFYPDGSVIPQPEEPRVSLPPT